MADSRDSVLVTADTMLPADVAREAEDVGARKARLERDRLFVLAVLAGAFIALGALFSTVVGSGLASVPFGLARAIVGVAFSLGLVLVILGGAELFTGNSLMVMALAAGRIGPRELAIAWAIVYLGNFVGAIGTAVLAWAGGVHDLDQGGVGRLALDLAAAKAGLPFGRAVVLGVLCNVLVCLAVWLSLGVGTATGKIAVIVPPVTAFVAAGFEHSVANMFVFPFAMLAGGDGATVSVAGAVGNLVPVTIGNVIGGAGLVGLVYWFVYLRRRSRAS
jgi:formate/nitrite transporter